MKRLSAGGSVDRNRSIAFQFDGRPLTALAGDTLASALLANGVAILGTSVTAGRPRGVMSAGLEEAHAFVQLGIGSVSEPLVRATAIEVFDGLAAFGRITRGVLPAGPDPARFEKRFAHCDVLVVGAGPAGLAAAIAAGSSGARVILAETGARLGGATIRDPDPIDGVPAAQWVAAAEPTLGGCPEVRVLRRTTAMIGLDQNGVVLVERVSGHLPASARAGRAERRLWQVRAREVIIATGALERPMVFPDNDRPGVMLAGAVRTYLHQFAVAPDRTVVFTANDDAYRTAVDLVAAGRTVVAVVDARPAPAGEWPSRARAAGIEILADAVVVGTEGDGTGVLAAVTVRSGGADRRLVCDVLAVSGGWDPALDLVHQLRAPTRWDERIGGFVPVPGTPGRQVAGAAAGDFTLGGALGAGHTAGIEAARRAGFVAPAGAAPTAPPLREAPPAHLWRVPAPDGDESRSFVDLHRDVTVAGLLRATGAGIQSVEHLKRYTLAGTGVEQGRSAKVNAAVVAQTLLGQPPGGGTSSARPPVEPISFGTMAARAVGPRFEPTRTTPIHSAHAALGAVFENVGQWKRARYFPRAGESMDQAAVRECRAVRTGVGIMDASTLGKIDVQGPDAAEFLERLYMNRVANLKPGRARYAAMARLDGSLFDDGVIMRLAPDRFFVTTSTSHAGPVMDAMEEWLQTEWPDLKVWCTSITEQWVTLAVAGPEARAVLNAAGSDLDLSKEAFPFMAVRPGRVAGLAGLVARVSFSGELAFEVSVPGHDGPALWQALTAAGASHGITPYGLEALSVLRAEKGYLIVGQDTDASTTAIDAGLGWLIKPDRDYLGRRSLARPDFARPDRYQLVGFRADAPVMEGAQLVTDGSGVRPVPMAGAVTTSHWSEALGGYFGLALVKGGRARIGETLEAHDGARSVPVRLADPVAYDRQGVRRDG